MTSTCELEYTQAGIVLNEIRPAATRRILIPWTNLSHVHVTGYGTSRAVTFCGEDGQRWAFQGAAMTVMQEIAAHRPITEQTVANRRNSAGTCVSQLYSLDKPVAR